MTEEEAQILRQENCILKLRAENTSLKKQRDDLQRMHEANQRYISKLQRALDKSKADYVESFFKG